MLSLALVCLAISAAAFPSPHRESSSSSAGVGVPSAVSIAKPATPSEAAANSSALAHHHVQPTSTEEFDDLEPSAVASHAEHEADQEEKEADDDKANPSGAVKSAHAKPSGVSAHTHKHLHKHLHGHHGHHHNASSLSAGLPTASIPVSSAAEPIPTTHVHKPNVTLTNIPFPTSVVPKNVTSSIPKHIPTTSVHKPNVTLTNMPLPTSVVPKNVTTVHPVPSSVPASSSLPASVKPTVASSSIAASPSVAPSVAAYLAPHNAMRAKHQAAPLTWSAQLASAAQTWASKCVWAHSQGAVGSFGENLAAGTGNFTAEAAVAAWNAEEPQYNPANPVASHWTQIVWKGTTQVGCAVAACPGLLNADVAHLHVCEYSPPGNILGEFPANVS